MTSSRLYDIFSECFTNRENLTRNSSGDKTYRFSKSNSSVKLTWDPYGTRSDIECVTVGPKNGRRNMLHLQGAEIQSIEITDDYDNGFQMIFYLPRQYPISFQFY